MNEKDPYIAAARCKCQAQALGAAACGTQESERGHWSLPKSDQPFVVGSVTTPVGKVPVVTADLSREDRWGSVGARWSIGRLNYSVDPGLYAVGAADADSPVLVTANYKMSFDCLRKELKGRTAWILVLDTHGINVWCAAGKGTFSTDELVRLIQASGLERVVNHRKLILPQLAAPGVAAHEVRELSGFRVMYGPILAADLGAYIDDGFKAKSEMRRKTFTMWERTTLVPVELVQALKAAAVIAPIVFLLGGLGGPGGFWANVLGYGTFAVCALLAAIVAGAVVTPIMLPWLPGRAFAVKGLIPGLVAVFVLLVSRAYMWGSWPARVETAAWLLLIMGLTTYLSMNFTGASTYTSLSGVRKEMRWAVPCQIVSIVSGLGLWLTSRFTS